jgi:hypothetical protein
MKKTIADQLSSGLGRRDEKPNIELAIKIARTKNEKAVAQLISLLSNSLKAQRHDAIKVLYEVGERRPELIVRHTSLFLKLLRHPDNPMKWGAMSALSAISRVAPAKLAGHLVDIVNAMDEGTVITRDHGVYILCAVAKLKNHYAGSVALLFEQIEKAPVNQVPMYAEKTAEVLAPHDHQQLIQIIGRRTDVYEIPTKAKRLEKLVRNLKS